jgi:hypothetical protein
MFRWKYHQFQRKKFEDTKMVITNRKSKDRKTMAYRKTMAKRKRTNNNIQNTTQKTKDQAS